MHSMITSHRMIACQINSYSTSMKTSFSVGKLFSSLVGRPCVSLSVYILHVQVCWTKDTYYLPIDEDRIPTTEKGKAYISYYQWVALVLVCQACLFYLPRFLWHMLNKKSGIAVSTVTGRSHERYTSGAR